MAQFHEGKNTLSSKANRNIIVGILFFLLVMTSFYIIFMNQIQIAKWYYFLPIMIFLVLASYFVKRGMIFKFGAKGENLGVIQALHLPEGYHVFTNVTISYQNYSQETDLIIVGMKGVYVVEVKNHNGKIVGDAEATQWMQHKVGRGGGRYAKKINNPVKQVKGQVYKLSKFLKEQGINVWVEGIILFTNSEVTVDVQSSSIPILFPAKRLSHYILTCKNRQYLNKALITKVAEMIAAVQEES